MAEDSRIMSDDETETKFMDDICWVDNYHWLHTQMPWNTIHGVPWKKVGELGGGNFGRVSLGQRETDLKFFAVKSVVIQYPIAPWDRMRIECQINEIYMMRFLRSKYIPRCLGCGRSNGENGTWNQETMDVLMEFAPKGSLSSIYHQKINNYLKSFGHLLLCLKKIFMLDTTPTIFLNLYSTCSLRE
jgi:serine/threonine protein kinase